jgi:hypothetical protein
MRRDDVRRFCLPCSEETGRLVERACPALDAKRERAAEARKERAAAERAEERERFLLADGTDTRRLLRRARKLPAWGRQSELAQRAVSRCRADVAIGNPGGSHGRAWGRSRVHVHLRKDAHPALALALIVHELTHVACHAEGRRGHDRYFWTLWLDAMTDVYPGLRVREREVWANRDAAQKTYAGTGLAHYALEWGNSLLLRRLHEETV